MSELNYDETIESFIEECREHLSGVEKDLLNLEECGENIDMDLINKLFRAAHSVKGISGYMGFQNIQKLAHNMESIFEMIRKGTIITTHEIVDVLLDVSDTLVQMVNNPDSTKDMDISDQLNSIEKSYQYALLQGNNKTDTSPIKSKLKKEEKNIAPTCEKKKTEFLDNSLRVHSKILDIFMNLAGELVLTRKQLISGLVFSDKDQIESTIKKIESITAQFHDAIMSARMQPISNIFNKFKRLVRDISNGLDKKVNLIVEGEDVTLDKNILETISDPLIQIIRNCIDHGIEIPEERRRLGKNISGTLILRSIHEAGQMLIEIIDDGAGIDYQKIKKKAFLTGLYNKDQLDEMSEKELIRLIFQPGFSLATEITNISGRGVGMDIVYNNLLKIGGTIDIDTCVGKGTAFHIRLPITTAIIYCLLVSIGDKYFAIPQNNIQEVIRIPANEAKDRIEKISDSMVLNIRDNILPIINLRDFLYNSKPTFKYTHEINIVIVMVENLYYGIIVDSLINSEESVVRSLGKHFFNCSAYSGATIMGDGGLAMILDIKKIGEIMKLSNSDKKVEMVPPSQEKHKKPILIIKNAASQQFAILVYFIIYIEKIRREEIEIYGERCNIKYKGDNLSLFLLDKIKDIKSITGSDQLYIIIFSFREKKVGLLVSEIIEIIEDNFSFSEEVFPKPYINGSTIIMNETTHLLDLDKIAQIQQYKFNKNAYNTIPN